MKCFYILMAAFFVAIPLFSQEEENLIEGKVEVGGFGAPVWKITRLNGETVGLTGGRGGVIINHTLVLGGGGYSTFADAGTSLINSTDNEKLFLRMEYSGFEIEYIHRSSKMLHWTIYTLLGSGRLEIREHEPDRTYAKENFFVCNASVNAELNVIKWCRLNVGAGYRVAMGVDVEGVENRDISGSEAHVTVKFGKF
jgi:hypothetical protein